MQPANKVVCASRWSPISTSAIWRRSGIRRPPVKAAWLALWLALLGPAWANYTFSDRSWAIEGHFPDEPKTDGILTPSPHGDVKVQRFYWEPSNEHYLLARFEYPLALLPGAENGLYMKAFTDLLKSRPGQVRTMEKFALGPYEGEKYIIAQQREKSLREVRFVLIGSILYMASAEWPEQGTGAARAAQFFEGLQIRSGFLNPRQVADNDRWRELASGRFRLRYDATRWYRDPADQESGVFNLLRLDQRAEAQFIAEPRPLESGDIERAVLETAHEGAESVTVGKRGKKLRGAIEVIELEFVARVDRVAYRNHGYFYSGPEGTVQLRGWANDKEYSGMEGDIGELLDGLTVVPGPGK